ncbi:hypothetical protein, partial [Shewanella morhuae]|uniref:hypothetical protein n=1 Tax=Shewanella morhuae TaxID=365591 RepID=UPI001C7E0D63
NAYKNKDGLSDVLELIDLNLTDFEQKNVPFINEKYEPLEALDFVKLIHSEWEQAVLTNSRIEIRKYSIIEKNFSGENESAKALEAMEVAAKIAFILGYEKLSLELAKAGELHFREVIRRKKAGISKAGSSTTKQIANKNKTTVRGIARELLRENELTELREAIQKIKSSKSCHVSEKTIRNYIKDLFPTPKKGRPSSK